MAYVTACGADTASWERRWEEAARADAERLPPDRQEEGEAGAVPRPDALRAGRPRALLVLVVDQFEEVFTLCRDLGKHAAFLNLALAGWSGSAGTGGRWSWPRRPGAEWGAGTWPPTGARPGSGCPRGSRRWSDWETYIPDMP
ncbi:hypothetical protein [Streptomyces sp. NPDC058308]|uniref:nSTAND1 domain-containing NTPase n=1 Tax=Streptomyces sp. NPDC058308 TaxID=3346440 RepID=UPI0036E01371